MSGHMRLAPHASSQGPLRPAVSALALLAVPAVGLLGASLLAAREAGDLTMPFARSGPTALTERLDVRVAPAEKARLRAIADDAGITVARA